MSLLVIIPLAFETLPVLSLQNSKDMFVAAYESLSKVSAIENSVLNRHPRRKHVWNFLKNLVGGAKNFLSGAGDFFSLAVKTHRGLKKYSNGGIGNLVKNIFQLYRWAGKFKEGLATTNIGTTKPIIQVSAFESYKG